MLSLFGYNTEVNHCRLEKSNETIYGQVQRGTNPAEAQPVTGDLTDEGKLDGNNLDVDC